MSKCVSLLMIMDIGGAGDESSNRPCAPQAGDGGSKERESQAASDPPNCVAVGLVPFFGEQGGKVFEEDCMWLVFPCHRRWKRPEV